MNFYLLMGLCRTALLILLSVTLPAAAQSGRSMATMAEVRVEDVSFQRVRDLAGETWWEASVELRVSPRSGPTGKFADVVRVGFNLALQNPHDSTDLQFYRAAVTVATLATGRQAFRFYLPPSVVSRDRIAGDVRFWVVDLSVAGESIPPTREHVSGDFSSAAAVENFRTQLAANAVANDGVLLPRHLLPAGTMAGTDPAVIRPEAVDVTP